MLRLLAAITSSFTACTVVSACAVQCGANPQKLASLQRGMTYEETSRIMGCPGQLVAGQSPASGDYSVLEWGGPDSILFKRTRIDFLEGKLLYYTTENRGGL
jgi:hypothetical protein